MLLGNARKIASVLRTSVESIKNEHLLAASIAFSAPIPQDRELDTVTYFNHSVAPKMKEIISEVGQFEAFSIPETITLCTQYYKNRVNAFWCPQPPMESEIEITNDFKDAFGRTVELCEREFKVG